MSSILLPTLKSKAKEGQVGNVRDRLIFTDEWSHTDSSGVQFCLRMYWTKGGTYGPQCQAVLWIYGPGVPDLGPWVSSRTTGCGYNKQDAAIHEVLRLAGYTHSEGSDYKGIPDAIGIDRQELHHSHG
jgi:hypothetical protein